MFDDGRAIYDIVAIDDTHFLLGSNGLKKTTKDQLLKHYYEYDYVFSLCHVTDSLYLLAFNHDGLILWDEKTE
jgi:hypothetical protein